MTAVPYTHQFDTPSSVAIATIWYDDVLRNLYVQFKNGAFAGYTSVPPEVFNGFKTTDSVGRYYNREFARHNFVGATLPQQPEMQRRAESLVPKSLDNSTGPFQVSVMVTIESADSPGAAVDVVADAVKAAGLKVDKVRVAVVE